MPAVWKIVNGFVNFTVSFETIFPVESISIR